MQSVDCDQGSSTSADNAFRTHGVTTILDLMDAGCSTIPPSMAGAVAYHPEWVFCGCHNQYTGGAQLTPDQHGFGLATFNKQLPLAQTPAYVAIGAVDPQYVVPASEQAPTTALYERLLVLMSGVQMAGPHLTAATFARGLGATAFPNPGAARPPLYQATVGFGHAHTMIRDYGIWWWDSSQSEADTGRQGGGGYCFADRGRRWSAGSWPTSMRLFSGPCR
jgi:hypothetical protein